MPNPEMEILALTIIGEAERPVGSAKLAVAFNEAGFHVAEATAGRFLRSLDDRGYTTIPQVKQGRILTAAGARRLRELEDSQSLAQRGAQLVRVAKDADLDELLDILVVRRAVEAEGARLAALHAPDDELHGILEQARAVSRTIAAGRTPDRESSTRFHRSVASASQNRVLASFAHLLIEPANPNLTKALEEVSLGSQAVADQSEDHVALAEALADRRAEAAQRLLHEHVGHLIGSVEAYLHGASAGPRGEAAG